MDFLTQPFQTLRSARPAAENTSPRILDNASVVTSSTSDTSEARQTSNSAFDKLRTARHELSPLLDETPIDAPSTKNGDWRAYGRVEGGLVLWESGALREKKVLSDPALRREEWALSGTLWFTKRSEILFVIDRNVPPRVIAREVPGAQSRRLSFSRLRSRSPSTAKVTENEKARDEGKKADKEDSSNHGFFAKVLDVVKPGHKERRSSSSSSEGLSLSLSRSRSQSRSRLDTTHPGSTSAPSTGSVARETAHEEPPSESSPSPLPLYKDHVVTALYVSSPSHIQSHRYFPQKSASDSFSFFSFAKSSQPLVSPPVSPELNTPGLNYPSVEIDIIDPAHLGSMDEGRKREATFSLVFLDPLCASEADDFYGILTAGIAQTGEEVPIHRTVSRSLEIGAPQKRKSFSLKV